MKTMLKALALVSVAFEFNPPALAEIYAVHGDHLGTPVKLTDSDKRVVWSATNRGFGEGAYNTDPDGDGRKVDMPLRYPGQYSDKESGLHYNYFRYYDPTVGRYITSDPIGLDGGINTYAYVDGNPIIYSDAYGLCPAGTHLASEEEAKRYLEKADKNRGKKYSELACNQLVNNSINEAYPGTVQGSPSTTDIRNGKGPFEPLNSPIVGGLALFNRPGHVVFVTQVSGGMVAQFLGSQTSTGPAYVNLPHPYYWTPKFDEPGNVQYYGVCLPD